MANSDFLPSVELTLNDLGLRIAPPPAGPKLTLLGITSNTTLPIREPMTVSSAEKAMNALYFSGASGPTFPGELALAIEEATAAGAPNIEVIIIGTYTGNPLLQYICPTGTGLRYNDLSGAYEVLKNRDIDVVVPVGAYIDDIKTGLTANTNYGVQLANFLYQSTKSQNSAVGVIATSPVVYWAIQRYTGLCLDITGGAASRDPSLFAEMTGLANVDASGSIRNVFFSTPSTALTNEWLAYHSYYQTGLTPASVLSGYFKTSVFSGVYYNTAYISYLHGSYDLSFNRFENAATSSQLAGDYFTYWQARGSDGAFATDGRGVKVDAGAYVSVFCSPVKTATTQTSTLSTVLGASISNSYHTTAGAAAYGGAILSLAPQSSTTNKPIGGLIPLKTISAAQANILTGLRLVTMYTRSKGFVVASGVTGAYNVNQYLRSDFVRLTTVRIVHTVVDLIRAIGDKFLGEPNNAPQMNALNAEIDQVLLSMKSAQALNGYDFVVSSTPEQRVLGQADVSLTLVPAFEITKINLTVSLADSI